MTEQELFNAFKMDVYRTCYYMLKNQEDAEDVCHEVFVKVFLKGYSTIENLKPWILSITMNECRNYLKKKARIVLFQDFTLFSKNLVAKEKIDGRIEQQEIKEELVYCIAKLKPKIKEVIVLKYLHLLKNEEISSVLNIPIGTVKSRANKGLFELKKLIGMKKEEFLNRGIIE